ncbi:MAG: hypothetical protein JO068_01985 [Hyphomicrobiales bacterium]|nr:hypothetical protein [Hyphomicrobiales bacterium]
MVIDCLGRALVADKVVDDRAKPGQDEVGTLILKGLTHEPASCPRLASLGAGIHTFLSAR